MPICARCLQLARAPSFSPFLPTPRQPGLLLPVILKTGPLHTGDKIGYIRVPFSAMKMRLSAIPLILVVLSGCIQTLAVRTVGGILDEGMGAFYEESDLDLAREGLSGNLKLLEALLKSDPENEGMLLFAAQGFASYSLAFAEDDSLERARALYKRSRSYAFRAFRVRTGLDLAGMSLEEIQTALPGLSRDDVPYVFWAAFTWGSYINLSRDNLSAMADISKVDALMRHVLETDRTYYYSGADLYFGAMKASIPAVLGGRPEEAREHFERAIAANNGGFLMAYVIFAQTYCAQTLNEELFDELIATVESASLDDNPTIRLPNAIAKKKASRLKALKPEIF